MDKTCIVEIEGLKDGSEKYILCINGEIVGEWYFDRTQVNRVRMLVMRVIENHGGSSALFKQKCNY